MDTSTNEILFAETGSLSGLELPAIGLYVYVRFEDAGSSV